MKKNVISIYVVILLGVLAFNLNILYADNAPYPKNNPKEDLAPTEVCVYTDAGYFGYEKCWKHGGVGEYFHVGNNLPSEFVNTISSIRVGSEVECMVFTDDYYKGFRILYTKDIENLSTGKYDWNDQIESLRIISKEALKSPNMVCIFTDAGYVGNKKCYVIEPRQRYILLKHIAPAISSIRLSENVGCMLFENTYFSGYGINTGKYKVHLVKEFGTYKRIWRAESLIVYRKDEGNPVGVRLMSRSWYKQFFPLPGDSIFYSLQPRFNNIRWVTFLDGKGQENLFADLYDTNGKVLTLSGNAEHSYDLETLNWNNRVVVAIRVYTTPPPQIETAAPKQSPQHDKATNTGYIANLLAKKYPNLSGTWKSNMGLVYQISQSGNKLSYEDPLMHKPVNGTVDGKTVTVSWMEGTASKELKGTVTSMEGENIAKTISWANGVIFNKLAKSPTVTATPSQPSQVDMATGGVTSNMLKQYSDLSGTWKSNMGLVYQISQSGNKLSYQDPLMHKTVNGTTDGKTVTVSWTEGNAVKNLKGTITSVGNDNKAKQITWANGAIFKRLSTIPTQPPKVEMSTGYVAAQKGVQQVDLSGTWNSNIGLVYQISQNGNKLTYQDPMMHKTVNGTIDGKTVTVSWTEGNAVKNLKGSITLVGGDGKAKRIEWENSVVYHR